jgi:hypothetical protein
MVRAPRRGPRPRVVRLRAHGPHQPLHAFAIKRLSPGRQVGRHAMAAVERRAEELLIDHPHQPLVRLGLDRRLVVKAGAVGAQELALAAHAQPRVTGLDQEAPSRRVRARVFSSTQAGFRWSPPICA